MAHLPYDVVYRIAEELAAVTKSDRSDGRARDWPFDHPALLPSDLHSAKNLRACALVCKAWSAPTSAVNVRHLDIWQATPKAISTALSEAHDDRYALVRHFQAGRELCPDCETLRAGGTIRVKGRAGRNCWNGVTAQTLLSTLSRCTNVRRVTVHEWAWYHPHPLIDFSPYTPVDSVTSLCLGLNVHASRPFDVRSFRHLLRLLPALKSLSFGRLDEASAVDSISPPDFKLETLAVRDAHLSGFSDYEWLLSNSRMTLRTLWVYNMINGDSRMALFHAIHITAGPLRTLYYIGPHAYMDVDVLGACSGLEELCLDARHALPMLQSISASIDRYAALRKLSLSTDGCDGRRPTRVALCLPEHDVRTLRRLLSNGVHAFPKLEVLSILTSPNVVVTGSYSLLSALKALQRACELRGISFTFPRMAELETAALRVNGGQW